MSTKLLHDAQVKRAAAHKHLVVSSGQTVLEGQKEICCALLTASCKYGHQYARTYNVLLTWTLQYGSSGMKETSSVGSCWSTSKGIWQCVAPGSARLPALHCAARQEGK